MTKFLIMAIVLRPGWDVKFPLPPSVKEELTFWKENVRLINGSFLLSPVELILSLTWQWEMLPTS